MKILWVLLALVCFPAQAAQFSISTVGSSQNGFSTFNPNNPHTARNSKGTFFGYLADANAPFTSQRIKVLWFANDPLATTPVTLFDQTIIGEAPCIVAASTGEVFMVNLDWINDILTVTKWVDVATSTTPSVFTFTGRPTRGNGKFTCAWDEQRRSIFFAGSGGEVVQISESGALTVMSIIAASTYPMMYPSLFIGHDGQVDMSWITVDPVPSNPAYYSIQYLSSRNPVGAWSTNGLSPWAWQAGGAPIPTNSGWYVTYTNEIIQNQNKLNISMASDDVGNVHFVYMTVAGYGERCFAIPSRCTLTYIRKDRKSQVDTPTAISRPLRGDTIFPHGAYGGSLAVRGQQLYFVTAYADKLVALMSSDWGQSWHDFASYTIPGVSSACVHDLGGGGGATSDTDMIGSFSIWRSGDCVAWANGTTSSGVSDIVYWRLGF